MLEGAAIALRMRSHMLCVLVECQIGAIVSTSGSAEEQVTQPPDFGILFLSNQFCALQTLYNVVEFKATAVHNVVGFAARSGGWH